jgi:lipoprotein-anchoring transpeptidase ErfK/SrfK
VPGGIPPGAAGSAEQDAILREAMRSRVPIRPGQLSPQPDDPRVTGSTGDGGDPRNMAAFPPDVQPETGPKKQLPAQFRRTLVDYPTKEPVGTVIIDTPNTYLYLVLGNSKASAAKALLGLGCSRSRGWRRGPIGIRRRR